MHLPKVSEEEAHMRHSCSVVSWHHRALIGQYAFVYGKLPSPCHNQDVGIFANVYLEAGHVLEVLVGVSAAVAGIVVVAKDHTLLSYISALVSKMFIHHDPHKREHQKRCYNVTYRPIHREIGCTESKRHPVPSFAGRVCQSRHFPNKSEQCSPFCLGQGC